MTTYTNGYGLPAAYVNAVVAGDRTPKPRTISVTELVKPVQVRTLEVAHAHELVSDVADRLPAAFGTAFHEYLARHAGPSSFAEQTLSVEVDGWTVHGTPDAVDWLAFDDEDGTLIDWKTTLYRSLKAERWEWEAQLNCYAHLIRLAGLPPVQSLVIWAYLRDWDGALRASDPLYPSLGIVRKDVMLWEPALADRYLRWRLAAHRAAQEDGVVPECTDAERWVRYTYALVKEGNGRATRVFDTQAEAQQYAEAVTEHPRDWRDWYVVEERKGQPIRCLSWCAARPWCGQAARELDGDEQLLLVAQ